MNAPTMPDPELPQLDLPVMPPLLFLGPLALTVLAHVLLDLPALPIPTPTAYWIGGIVIVHAIVLFVWSIRTFMQHGEDPHPPKPTNTLVDDGPYGFSRNPIYLAMALFVTGVAIAMRSWAVLASVPVSLIAIHYLVIRREEPYLDAVLGDSYRAYRDRVRRYL